MSADEEEPAPEEAPSPPKPKKKKKKKIAADLKAGIVAKKGPRKKKPKTDDKPKKVKRKKKKKDQDDEKAPQKKLFLPGEEKLALAAFGKVVEKLEYQGQLEFFMNAMWSEHCSGQEKDCVKMYEWMGKFEELALDAGGKSKHDLDDFQSARFLEYTGNTMTVVRRRKELAAIDIDENNRMGLLEYLVYTYKTDILTLMNRPQGTNQALKDAEKALKKVMKIIRATEAEKARLDALIAEGKGLKAIRAKAELAQLLDKDPLPLNKALITAEAALRKAEKSKDLSAAGKKWVLRHEYKQAKKYKPRGGVAKGRFSVSGKKKK